MSADHLLGIDVGTTSIKIGLFRNDGILVAMSNQEYSLLTPSSNVVELSADVYWRFLCKGIKDILDKSGVHPQSILALSLSSQGETLIFVDNKGRLLRNAIVWLDTRAEEEAEEIAKNFPKERLYEITGYPELCSFWPAAKILWLKRNEPYIFNHTSKFLIVKDYLIWKLTGEFSTDPSCSSSTYYLKVKEKDW